MKDKLKILGVRIDNVSEEEALGKIEFFLNSKEKHQVVTPNPEFLVEAKKNKEFKKVLNSSSLSIPDGIGIILAGKALGEKINRITGVDFMQKICKNFGENHAVFLLGAKDGIASKTGEILKQRYKKIKISGAFAGSPKKEDEEEIINIINKACPEILFVAYGAPSQELWIYRNLPRLKTVKIAMGIGGSFDFIAGIQKRAPKVFRNLGLEWLWRLMKEPKRIKRIFNAVIKFPYLFLKHRK